MATKKDAIAPTTGLRRCIGSTRFGIEAHEAEPSDFPAQPSQRDGLGRMCKPHWNQYTNALRKAALARKAEAGGAVAVESIAPVPTKEARARGIAEGKATRAAERNVNTGPRAPRKPKPPKPESPGVTEARERLAAMDKLGGKAYIDAIASDEGQDALRALAGTSPGPEVHLEAALERYREESALDETIDGSSEEDDAA